MYTYDGSILLLQGRAALAICEEIQPILFLKSRESMNIHTYCSLPYKCNLQIGSTSLIYSVCVCIEMSYFEDNDVRDLQMAD